MASSEFGLERFAHHASHRAQMLIDLLRHRDQLLPLAHLQPFHPPLLTLLAPPMLVDYNTVGIRAFTSFLYSMYSGPNCSIRKVSSSWDFIQKPASPSPMPANPRNWPM